MHLQKCSVGVLVLLCLHLGGTFAYPTINLRRLFDSSNEWRYKKSDVVQPSQMDEDVLELEHLRGDHGEVDEEKSKMESEQSERGVPLAPLDLDTGDATGILPELERQLESATLSTAMPAQLPAVVTDERPEHKQDGNANANAGQGAHRPPMLPHNDGGKTPRVNQEQAESNPAADGGAIVPSTAKPFYGAARLAFGQNPEVLPTSPLTSSTAAPITTTAATAAPAPTPISGYEADVKILSGSLDQDPTSSQFSESVLPATAASPNGDDNNKETARDPVMADLSKGLKSTARRSTDHLMAPQLAEELLRNKEGQYSSFDMAQYVFWTGDDAGVARAVEELIERGLMTRESALKFLRDIRLGIQYLQRSYANRVFPDEIRKNSVKKNFQSSHGELHSSATTTKKPFLNLLEVGGGHDELRLRKPFDGASLRSKLMDLNEEANQELSNYDDEPGSHKSADFVYTEYTLEEILYNLAKVMFAQSLSHGSNEAQKELQKLTDFLEREGNRGVIPVDLQRKVLHILLTALSDTLNERPELLPAARLSLGRSFAQLPHHSYNAMQ